MEIPLKLSSLLLLLNFILGSESQLQNVCKINQFRCSDGSRCLPTEKLCNGKKDCPEGEDERGTAQWDCTKTLLSHACHPTKEFRCRFGGCVPREKICNSVPDCWGGTDESSDTCSGRKTQPPPPTLRPTTKPRPSVVTSRTQPPQYKPLPPRPQEARPQERPTQSGGGCPPIKESLSYGFDIKCSNEHGKDLGDCSSPSPFGSSATYKCAKYYLSSGVGSSSTMRTCQTNGQWTPRRSNFLCSLQCGHGGAETTALVTGGISSKKGKWPWHTALYHEDPPNSGKWDLKCGGSLITPQAILTAAHCTTRKFTESALPNKDIRIALGKFHRSYNRHDDGEQIRNVRHIEVHPEYNQNTLENDIAIIFLDEPAHINDYVRPVCIPNEDKAQDVFPGNEGNLVGWGRTTGGRFKEELQEAKIPVVDPHTCKQSHATFASLVRNTNFCAGYRNGTGACDGDSGSGLIFLDNDTKVKFNVQGIVSAGVAKTTGGGGGCEEKYYAVFTKVARFHNWIEAKLDVNYQR